MIKVNLIFTKSPRESEKPVATAEPVEDIKEPTNFLPQEVVKQKRKYTKKVVDKKTKIKN